MNARVLATAAVAAAALAAPAQGAVLCVPNTSVAADCAAPAATLQSALTAAVATPAEADTIRLGSGTFAGGSATPGATDAPITVVGQGRTSTAVQGATGALGLLRLSGPVTVRDVTIRSTSGTAGALDLSGRAEARSVTVEAVGATTSISGVATIGGYTGTTFQIADSTIRRADGSNPLIYGGGYSLSNTLVEATGTWSGNYIVMITSGSIVRRSVIRGPATLGLVYVNGTGTVITSTLFHQLHPDTPVLTAITSGAPAGATVADSTALTLAPGTSHAFEAVTYQMQTVSLSLSGIVARGFGALGCAGTNVAGGSATVVAQHSVAPNVSLTPCPATSNLGSETQTNLGGLVAADPLLANAAAGDVRLQAGSPAIDAGGTGPAADALDLYGAARMADGNGDGAVRRDAGAAEYAPPAPPPPADTTPPAGVEVTGLPSGAFSLRRGLTLGVAGSDPDSGLATAFLTMRTAPSGGAFGAPADRGPGALTLTPGATHCLVATALNGAGLRAASAERCVAFPFGVAVLRASGPWTTLRRSVYHQGRARTTRTARATLSRRNVVAKRIAIVATRGRGMGTVSVWLGSKRLKRVSLAAARTRRAQVIPIAVLPAARRGTVTIRVESRGKPVIVEGLAISRR